MNCTMKIKTLSQESTLLLTHGSIETACCYLVYVDTSQLVTPHLLPLGQMVTPISNTYMTLST